MMDLMQGCLVLITGNEYWDIHSWDVGDRGYAKGLFLGRGRGKVDPLSSTNSHLRPDDLGSGATDWLYRRRLALIRGILF